MERDEIIKLARRSGFGFMTEKPKSATHMQCGIDDLEHFAGLVTAAERERIAKKIEKLPFGDTSQSFAVWVRQDVP